SGHLHQSLWTGSGKDKRNVFYDPANPKELSAIGKSYVAGQVALMPELTAPWGDDNRTCAIRTIYGDGGATRIEYRQTAADINPYIAIATCLAAGLWGIENKMTPPPPGRGDASGDAAGFAALPRTLRDATARLAASETAKKILGAPFV